MTYCVRAARRRLRPGGFSRSILLLVALAAGISAPSHARGQTTQALLEDRRDKYESAKADYDAARSAYRVVERRFSSAMDELRRARTAGDNDAYQQGLSVVQDRARALDAPERRMRRTKEALDSARTVLIRTIEGRQTELYGQLDAVSSPQERSDLTVWLRDLNRELQTLEAEAGDALHPDPVIMPTLQLDPRDDPTQVLAKAELLERFAATADTAIQATDTQIKELNDRLRRQRQGADFVAGVQRFDDTRLPVVTNAPPGDPTAVADSTGAGARPMTLEERIQSLKDYKERLERYRDEALLRAKEFRRLVGSVA